ncbi:MAG: YggS family pyridoxal phosphate-dependent enzyme [Ekhidna sp.]
MKDITKQLQEIKNTLNESCTLIAVSKTKPNEDILEAYNAGHRNFGENKVQEMTQKAEELPKDINWHMIGHLQRNKVKYMASFVHLIHGVDTFKLLKEINKQAKKEERIIDCLLQIHIAKEDTKFGFDESEIVDLMDGQELKDLTNVQVTGLMGMATNTVNESQVRSEFNELKELFERLKKNNHANVQLSILSMGMSGDYKIALEEGSSMVRIGSAIFGSRD